MAFSLKTKGNLKRTKKLLKRCRKLPFEERLNVYADEGVRALSEATPKDTGKTRESWGYEIEREEGHVSLHWVNSNLSKDWFPVALYLQYGHATGTGGWVEGQDYINPALKPIYDAFADDIWKEVLG